MKDLNQISYHIRRLTLESLADAGSGHTGGSLGLADVFASLYFKCLKHDPKNPSWEDRDRLILSIGHVAPVYYSTLALAGYFDVKELKSLRKLGSRLQGHPATDHGIPGLESSSGSLGQGMSIAIGMALAAKMDNRSNYIYSVHGDGELQEGSIWEAAMSAGHYGLGNLISIVDRNQLQIDGKTSDVMALEPLAGKFMSFGWKVQTIDGHNHAEIIEAIGFAKSYKDQPHLIIANTSMGKGVKSIENDYGWHGKPPTKDQLPDFINQLKQYHAISE